ncbi:MAG: hypothetical protein Q9195_002033 [Heterodermia aff. obscurata]
MSKIKDLQKATLTSAELLAKADTKVVEGIFTEEKHAKHVLNAAKRVSKKRAAGDTELLSPAKRKKTSTGAEIMSPASVEASLALPLSNAEEDELCATTLYTNRAPLVLAFAVVLLQYTMTSQPLSSRLSLAQAVVSVNSRSKAMSLGIEKGKNAEDEGWGQGQPTAKVMGRVIRVMKRWGYNPKEGNNGTTFNDNGSFKLEDGAEDSQATIKGNETSLDQVSEELPALWGLDLEALRAANGPLVPGKDTSKLPIYTPQSARAYILKSFASAPSLATVDPDSPRKKPSAAAIAASKEKNLGLLLRALDLLYSSWAQVLSTDELDRRAWSFYVNVRPEVENGVAGWGGKGEVKLAQILAMRRKG